MKRTVLCMALLYVLLFIARAAYDFATFSEVNISDNYNVYYAGEKSTRSVNNYASLKMDYAPEGISTSVLDQKYERIANITAKTVNYDDDMARFGAALEEYKAVVQTEYRSGLVGGRRAELAIGVRPENFSQMQDAISKIGVLTSSTTTTTDKTYEYRQMLAEKETLEKRRASYEELKKYGDKIPDLLQLEERIIEVEAQIQQQLIGLGEYSDDNALCTINYIIFEGTETGAPRKIWNALVWTTTTYAVIAALLLLTAVAAFVAVWCWVQILKLLKEKPTE